MLRMYVERSRPWPIRADRASAITIEKTAITSGTTAATTAPNTSTRITSAAGDAEIELSVFRSSARTCSRSRSALHSPVIVTSKAPPSAAATTSISRPAPSSQSPMRPTGITVARRFSETRDASPLSYVLRALWTTPVARTSPSTSSTLRRNSSWSTVRLAERTRISSETYSRPVDHVERASRSARSRARTPGWR